jgi:hypothetical protein
MDLAVEGIRMPVEGGAMAGASDPESGDGGLALLHCVNANLSICANKDAGADGDLAGIWSCEGVVVDGGRMGG